MKKDTFDDNSWIESSLIKSGVGNWLLNIEGKEMLWSSELYNIFGLNEETCNPSFSRFLKSFHPDDVDVVTNFIEESLINKASFSFNARVIKPTGDICHISTSCDVGYDENGVPTQILATVKEDNQLDEENKFKTLIERVSDAFVSLDRDFCYTYLNKRAGEIFGRKPEDLIGKHIWTEFPEGIDQPFYKAYYRAMETQEYEYMQEYYPPYDLWFENHIYPSKNGLSIYFKDITIRKKNEEQIASYQSRLEAQVDIRTLELVEQNKIISEQKKEIGDVIKELHHRVKNNMQLIISLFRLQAEKVKSKQAIEIFLDCQNRIYSMALVHEQMYQSENLTKINTEYYFKSLIKNIIESSNAKNNISTDLKIDSLEMPTRIMIALGLLVNEIILNSLKHAFTNLDKGKIIFRFNKEPDNTFKIVIGDNGSGFNPENEEKGLGMDLIDSFIDTIDGEYSRSFDKGTMYEINFGMVDIK